MMDPQERIKRNVRWIELSQAIRKAGDEMGEKRFDEYLPTLDLSKEDIKEIIVYININTDMVRNGNNYCIRKLKALE